MAKYPSESDIVEITKTAYALHQSVSSFKHKGFTWEIKVLLDGLAVVNDDTKSFIALPFKQLPVELFNESNTKNS